MVNDVSNRMNVLGEAIRRGMELNACESDWKPLWEQLSPFQMAFLLSNAIIWNI